MKKINYCKTIFKFKEALMGLLIQTMTQEETKEDQSKVLSAIALQQYNNSLKWENLLTQW